MSDGFSIRLPRDIAKKLDALAKRLERSRTFIVKKAIEEYLEEYEDYLVAVHRLRDQNDALVSEKGLVYSFAP
jgi:RHH-type transcriptional regulator, rel operon repressor / antitoxin RelB